MQSWIDFLSPLLAGLAGGTVAALLARLGASARPDRQGWHHIRPSMMHWLGLSGSAAFASLMLYIRLFVGSARADADIQMMWANLIIAGFSLCTLISLWQIRRIRRGDVHWRGTTILFTDTAGTERVKPMTQVAGMDRRWTGTVAVSFGDGSLLLLDQYAKGVPELWNRIVEANGGQG